MEAIYKVCRGHSTRECQLVSNDHDLPEGHEDEQARKTNKEEKSNQSANAWLDNVFLILNVPSSRILAHREDVRTKPT
jgi:hypothetical protein